MKMELQLRTIVVVRVLAIRHWHPDPGPHEIADVSTHGRDDIRVRASNIDLPANVDCGGSTPLESGGMNHFPEVSNPRNRHWQEDGSLLVIGAGHATLLLRRNVGDA
jgi:hypothetical protein